MGMRRSLIWTRPLVDFFLIFVASVYKEYPVVGQYLVGVVQDRLSVSM